MNVDKPESDLSKYPWATIMVVFFSIVGGIITVIDESSLSFDEYLTLVLAASATLSIGRGLAYKELGVDQTPLSRLLNSVPWATVLVGVFSLVGAVVLVIGESDLNFQEYMTRVMAAAAVLGIGRGIAAYKKDNTLINTDDARNVRDAPMEYVEPTDENMGADTAPPTGDIEPPQKGV